MSTSLTGDVVITPLHPRTVAALPAPRPVLVGGGSLSAAARTAALLPPRVPGGAAAAGATGAAATAARPTTAPSPATAGAAAAAAARRPPPAPLVVRAPPSTAAAADGGSRAGTPPPGALSPPTPLSPLALRKRKRYATDEERKEARILKNRRTAEESRQRRLKRMLDLEGELAAAADREAALVAEVVELRAEAAESLADANRLRGEVEDREREVARLGAALAAAQAAAASGVGGGGVGDVRVPPGVGDDDDMTDVELPGV